MNFKDKLKQIPGAWYFLMTIVLAYFVTFILNNEIFVSGLSFFTQTISKMIPIFFIIFVLMSLSNYFITPKFIIKHLKERGVKKWFFVVVGGILSSGPIYMWYPLLSDLRKKDLSYGLIACFLYNRAIKIPLLPLAIAYFSWQYILVLSIVMIAVSIIQGILIDHLIDKKNIFKGKSI